MSDITRHAWHCSQDTGLTLYQDGAATATFEPGPALLELAVAAIGAYHDGAEALEIEGDETLCCIEGQHVMLSFAIDVLGLLRDHERHGLS